MRFILVICAVSVLAENIDLDSVLTPKIVPIYLSSKTINELKRNISVYHIDLDDKIGKHLEDFFANATSLVRSKINDKDKIVSESEVIKHENNKTNILAKGFAYHPSIDKVTERNEEENFKLEEIKLTSTQTIEDFNIFNDATTTESIEDTTVTALEVTTTTINGETREDAAITGTDITTNQETEVTTEQFPITVESKRKITTESLIEELKTKSNEINNEYLDFNVEDNSSDYAVFDYVEFYKDTTNEDVEFTTRVPFGSDFPKTFEVPENVKDSENLIDFMDPVQEGLELNFTSVNAHYFCNTTGLTISDAIFPSIATIFVKNETNDQFDYNCDGVLVSEKVVLTSARCVFAVNKKNSENILVILGKRNLQVMTGKEVIARVSEVKTHENFSSNPVQHDLAILVLETPVPSSPAVHPACLWPEGGQEDLASTTGWDVASRLTDIHFNEHRSKSCSGYDQENTLCATYGNAIATCPSYGGAYASMRDGIWYVTGIHHGDPSYRGICFSRDVFYTDLSKYKDWLESMIE